MKKIILTAMIFCMGTVALLNASFVDVTDLYWNSGNPRTVTASNPISASTITVDSFDRTISVAMTSNALYVTRYDNYAGSPDSTFGIGGTKEITVGITGSGKMIEIAGYTGMDTNLGPAVIIDSNNNILLAFQSMGNAYVIRLLSTTGALDTDFNGTGVVSLEANNFSAGSTIHTIGGLLIDTYNTNNFAGGILIVAGATLSDGTTKTVFVARLTSSGVIDTNFEDGGYVSLDSVLTTVESATISTILTIVDGKKAKVVIVGQESGTVFWISVSLDGTVYTLSDGVSSASPASYSGGKISYPIDGLDSSHRVICYGDNYASVYIYFNKGTDIYRVRVQWGNSFWANTILPLDGVIDTGIGSWGTVGNLAFPNIDSNIQSLGITSISLKNIFGVSGSVFVSGIMETATETNVFVLKLFNDLSYPYFGTSSSITSQSSTFDPNLDYNYWTYGLFTFPNSLSTDLDGGGNMFIDSGGGLVFSSYDNTNLYVQRALGYDILTKINDLIDTDTSELDDHVLVYYKTHEESLFYLLFGQSSYGGSTGDGYNWTTGAEDPVAHVDGSNSLTFHYSDIAFPLKIMISLATANNFPSCITMLCRTGLFKDALTGKTNLATGNLFTSDDLEAFNSYLTIAWNNLFVEAEGYDI